MAWVQVSHFFRRFVTIDPMKSEQLPRALLRPMWTRRNRASCSLGPLLHPQGSAKSLHPDHSPASSILRSITAARAQHSSFSDGLCLLTPDARKGCLDLPIEAHDQFPVGG